MIILRPLYRFHLETVINKLKQDMLALKVNLQMCVKDIDKDHSLLLTNHVIQQYLSQDIYENFTLMTRLDNQESLQLFKQILPKYINNEEFLGNAIRFLESQALTEQMHHFMDDLLLQKLQMTEFTKIHILILTASLYMKHKSYFTTFAQMIRPREILTELVFMLLSKTTITLEKEEVQQLEQIKGSLSCYAKLFISIYKEVEPDEGLILIPLLDAAINQNMSLTQLDYVCNQLEKQVMQIPTLYIVNICYHLHEYVYHQENPVKSEHLNRFLQELYVQRLSGLEVNPTLIYNIVKPFSNLIVSTGAFNNYLVHARLIRYLLLQYKQSQASFDKVVKVIKTLSLDLWRLNQSKKDLFEEFTKLFNSLEYDQPKQTIIEIVRTQRDSQVIYLINLFRVQVPDDFYHEYLKQLQPTSRILQQVARAVSEQSTFWNASTVDEDLDRFIDFVLSTQTPIFKFLNINFLISNSKGKGLVLLQKTIQVESNQTLIQFIQHNQLCLINNKETFKLEFPDSIREQLKQDILTYFNQNKIMKDKKDAFSLYSLLNTYLVVGSIDDIKEDLIKYIMNADVIFVETILRANIQCRQLLKDSPFLKRFIGKSGYIEIFLNHKSTTFTGIQEANTIKDVIFTNQQNQFLPLRERKLANDTLFKKLTQIDAEVTFTEAYEILMGWQASQFQTGVYIKLINVIKEKIHLFDFLHIYKLVNKLIHTNHFHFSFMYKVYNYIQTTLENDLSKIAHPVQFLKTCELLIENYSDIPFEIEHQKSNQGKIIAYILSIMINDQESQTEYFETVTNLDDPELLKYYYFYPYLYKGQKDFGKYFPELNQQLEVCSFLQQEKIPVQINQRMLRDLILENQTSMKKLFQIVSLISLTELKHDQTVQKAIASNLQRLDPHNNRILDHEMALFFEALKSIFQENPPLNKLEYITGLNMHSYNVELLKYLLTSKVLSSYQIDQVDKYIA